MSGRLKQRLVDIRNTSQFKAVPPFPRSVMIEITNACNHRCEFCFSRKMKRKKGSIAPAFALKILKDTYENGAREVGFTTTGEPLLNERLFDYVSYAKDLGFSYVYFSTNGSLFDDDKIEKIFLSGLDSIKFSINAGTARTYARIHDRNDFYRVIRTIMAIDETRRRKGSDLKMFVSYIVTDSNAAELELLKGLIGRYVDEIITEKSVAAVGPTNSSVYSLPCPLLFNRMHVTFEGFLTCCCVDYENNLVVADLNKISVREAWHGDLLREFRQRHLAKDVAHTLCELCIFKKNEKFKPLLNV